MVTGGLAASGVRAEMVGRGAVALEALVGARPRAFSRSPFFVPRVRRRRFAVRRSDARMGAQMAEMRRDPLTDTYVLFSEARGHRPHEFLPPQAPPQRDACPFCAGNEQQTPGALATYPALPDRTDLPWQVRVVPNKYPAVFKRSERATFYPFSYSSSASGADPELTRPPAWWQEPDTGGLHEVIIESPLHLSGFTELSQPEMTLVMTVYRDRLRACGQDPQLAYALLFKNAGARAGASLEHIHSQLLALPILPAAFQYELMRTAEYAMLNGVGPLTDMLDGDLETGERIVAEDDQFVLWCPYASRFPYETWLIPREPNSRFEEATESELAVAAGWLRRLLLAYHELSPQPAYNFWIRSAPLRQSHPHFCWRLEVAPRVASLAGFELASGCFINPVFPEQAACQLRELLID